MLTIDWSPPSRHPRPNHRLLLRTLAVAFCALAFVVYFGITAHGGTSGGGPERITVVPGQTLWSIAASHAEGGDVRAELDAIVAANHLDATTVNPGQSLEVPPAP